jgi:hypothetical protein
MKIYLPIYKFILYMIDNTIFIFGLGFVGLYTCVMCYLIKKKPKQTRINNLEEIADNLNKCIVQINPLVDPDICCICLDEFSITDQNIVKLSCGHVYHRPCIFRWFLKKTHCPLCKTVF